MGSVTFSVGLQQERVKNLKQKKRRRQLGIQDHIMSICPKFVQYINGWGKCNPVHISGIKNKGSNCLCLTAAFLLLLIFLHLSLFILLLLNFTVGFHLFNFGNMFSRASVEARVNRHLLKLTVILVLQRLEVEGRACKVLLETQAFIFTPEKPN